VIVVVVRDGREVERRQRIERHAGRHLPLGAGERYRARALGEHGICHEGDPIHPHEHRGMADPGDAGIVLQRRRVVRHQLGGAAAMLERRPRLAQQEWKHVAGPGQRPRPGRVHKPIAVARRACVNLLRTSHFDCHQPGDRDQRHDRCPAARFLHQPILRRIAARYNNRATTRLA
jgi:hypothetical protein